MGEDFSAVAARVQRAKLPATHRRRRIRERSGLSLRAVATELGVSPMSVWRWELGVTRPDFEHAARYRALLDALDKANAAR